MTRRSLAEKHAQSAKLRILQDMAIGLRERKKQETHRALATAARELILERGIDAVTIDDIAEAAGVSPRTFFNYYESKEAAVVGIEPTVLEAARTSLEARPKSETPIEALTAVLIAEPAEAARQWRLRTELVTTHPSLLPRHLAALADLERSLIAGMAQRMGVNRSTDPTPAIVVSSTVATIRSVIRWWYESEPTMSLDDTLIWAMANLNNGLAFVNTNLIGEVRLDGIDPV